MGVIQWIDITPHLRVVYEGYGRELIIKEIRLHGPDITPQMLAEVSLRKIEAVINAEPFEGVTPELGRPGPKPGNGYYAQVACVYMQYAKETSSPASRIAAEVGVPVTTVHRWIRQARRRGMLPPAKTRRAG